METDLWNWLPEDDDVGGLLDVCVLLGCAEVLVEGLKKHTICQLTSSPCRTQGKDSTLARRFDLLLLSAESREMEGRRICSSSSSPG